jgi:hypothetical protein
MALRHRQTCREGGDAKPKGLLERRPPRHRTEGEKVRQRTHPLAPGARDPIATTMSRRSFLATASAIAAGAAMSPFLWSKVVRGAASLPGIRFVPGLGIRRNDTTWSGGLLRGGLLQPVQCPTRGQVVRLRPALLVLAEKKFE